MKKAQALQGVILAVVLLTAVIGLYFIFSGGQYGRAIGEPAWVSVKLSPGQVKSVDGTVVGLSAVYDSSADVTVNGFPGTAVLNQVVDVGGVNVRLKKISGSRATLEVYLTGVAPPPMQVPAPISQPSPIQPPVYVPPPIVQPPPPPVAEEICKPYVRNCIFDYYVEICNAKGTGWDGYECPEGTVCSTDLDQKPCTTQVCLPYTRKCPNENSVSICNAKGTGWDGYECPEGTVCSTDPDQKPCTALVSAPTAVDVVPKPSLTIVWAQIGGQPSYEPFPLCCLSHMRYWALPKGSAISLVNKHVGTAIVKLKQGTAGEITVKVPGYSKQFYTLDKFAKGYAFLSVYNPSSTQSAGVFIIKIS